MNFKTRLGAYILNNAGVISIPTDTVQGLSCLPKFENAVQKIITLKRRPKNKGLILIASDIHYLSLYVKNPSTLKNIPQNTPTPTTYLIPAHKTASPLLTGKFDTIALRLTDNLLIKELCQMTNSALVSTSANIATKPSATNTLKLLIFFKDKLDFIIPPQNHNNQTSRIINLQTGGRVR